MFEKRYHARVVKSWRFWKRSDSELLKNQVKAQIKQRILSRNDENEFWMNLCLFSTDEYFGFSNLLLKLNYLEASLQSFEFNGYRIRNLKLVLQDLKKIEEGQPFSFLMQVKVSKHNNNTQLKSEIDVHSTGFGLSKLEWAWLDLAKYLNHYFRFLARKRPKLLYLLQSRQRDILLYRNNIQRRAKYRQNCYLTATVAKPRDLNAYLSLYLNPEIDRQFQLLNLLDNKTYVFDYYQAADFEYVNQLARGNDVSHFYEERR